MNTLLPNFPSRLLKSCFILIGLLLFSFLFGQPPGVSRAEAIEGSISAEPTIGSLITTDDFVYVCPGIEQDGECWLVPPSDGKAGDITEKCTFPEILVGGECYILPPVPGVPGEISTFEEDTCLVELGAEVLELGEWIDGECWAIPPFPGEPGVITTVTIRLCSGIWIGDNCWLVPPTPVTPGIPGEITTTTETLCNAGVGIWIDGECWTLPPTPGVPGVVIEAGQYCNLGAGFWEHGLCWTAPPFAGVPGEVVRSCSGQWDGQECWDSLPVKGIVLVPPGEEDEGFSMMFASDSQFDWFRGGKHPDYSSSEDVLDKAKETNENMVNAMNDIMDLDTWPSNLRRGDGTAARGRDAEIPRPSGLIINGDLTEQWHPWQFDLYEQYYPNGLNHQIYPGLGNHDYSGNTTEDPLSRGCFYGTAESIYLDRNRCAKRAIWWMADQIEAEIPNIVNKDLSGFMKVDFRVEAIDVVILLNYELHGEIVSSFYSPTDGFEVIPADARDIRITFREPYLDGLDLRFRIFDHYVFSHPPMKCFEVTGVFGNHSSKAIPCAQRASGDLPEGSHGSLAYSFDIGEVHFVQLQYWPGYDRYLPENILAQLSGFLVSPDFDINPSYEWLEKDLQAATEAGKYIVINLHDVDNQPKVTDSEGDEVDGITHDEAFIDAVDGQNVVAIFAGHIHQKYGEVESSKVTTNDGKKIPVFLSGSAECERFLLVQFQRYYFDVGVVNASGGSPTFVTSSNDVCDNSQDWDDLEATRYDLNNGNPQPKEYRVDIDRPLVAWFGWPINQTLNEPEGKELSFHAAESDPDRTLTYTWDFGDGTTGSGSDPKHTYQDNGVYTVTGTARDNDGRESTSSFEIRIRNVAPTADAGPDQIYNPGEQVTLSGAFTDPGSDDTHTFRWRLLSSTSGHIISTPNTQAFSFTPVGNGDYTFEFTVTDDDGGQDTDTINIYFAQTDLMVTKTAASGPALVGEPLVYTLTVENLGPDTAENVVVTDNLPGGVSFVSATFDEGTCQETVSDSEVTCNLGDVNPNDSLEIIVTVTLNQTGPLTNQVEVTMDTFDLNPADNSASHDTLACDFTASDEASLNLAIACVNMAGSGSHTIDVTSNIDLASSTTPINNPDATEIILNGGGFVVDGNDNGRVFEIKANTTVSINDIIITGGNTAFPELAPYQGGGLLNQGVLTMKNSTVSGNKSLSSGGGFSNTGQMTLINSTVSGNTVSGDAGGGLSNTEGGQLTLINSTVSGNTAQVAGGLFNTEGGQLTLINSTVSQNLTTKSNPPRAALFNFGGVVILSNSVVAAQLNNETSDCRSTIIADEYNLDSDGTCGDATTASDPLLGPLQDNGGPTWTHALQTGSPAIDAGDNAVCLVAPVNDVDQRGIARSLQGLVCDLGAFESEATVDLQLTKTGQPNPATVGDPLIYTLEITNHGPDLATNVVLKDTLPSGLTLNSVSFSTDPGLALLLHLDETGAVDNTAISDSSGQGNHGTLRTGDSFQKAVTGQFGQALRLDGDASDYVIIDDFNNFPEDEISASFWMKAPPASADTSRTPMSYNVNGNDNMFLIFDYSDFQIGINGQISPNSGVSADDNQWHHIVITWRSAGGHLKIYKDGIEAYTTIWQSGASLADGGDFVLGQEQDSPGGGFNDNQAFEGLMDEVALYRRVLSPVEIEALYEGSCGSGRNIVCPLGSLAPGESIIVTIETTPASARLITNQAEVRSDSIELNPADNSASHDTLACDFTASDEVSLNRAIECVNNAGSGSHTIMVSSNIELTGSTTPINNPAATEIIINGNGFVVDGNGSGRVFEIKANTTVSINDITITGGNGGGLVSTGGGLLNRGNLTINNSTISGNSTTGGGGLSNSGQLTLVNSTVSGNSAINASGLSSTGDLTLINSTVSNNTALGATIFQESGTVTLINSIVANPGSGVDCGGTIIADGHNLDRDGSCGDAITGNPLLGPLQDNGGPAWTHALQAGSPAIGGGDNVVCLAALVNDRDQRGITRSLQGLACDLGAFEYIVDETDLVISKDNGQTESIPGESTTYTIIVNNNGPSNVSGATVIDTFPADLMGVVWDCAPGLGAVCTANGFGNINDIVDIPAGGSVTYTASGNILPTASGTLDNTATVTAPDDIIDPNPNNNSATDSDTLSFPQADLAITKDNGQTESTPGEDTTYTIVVKNNGPGDVSGATVIDTFPTDLLGVVWNCVPSLGAVCTTDGFGNINDTIDIPAGGSVTYQASGNILATASGTLDNTATVSVPDDVIDPKPDNNSATDSDNLILSPSDPPKVTITVHPLTSDSSAITFIFNLIDEATGLNVLAEIAAATTFECQLDGGGFSPCTSPKTYTNLTPGPHLFEVRSVDEAGNVDPTPATFSWTVAGDLPQTCKILTVHDAALRDSQLFTIDFTTLIETMTTLGPLYPGADVEGLGLNPISGIYYGASALDNVADSILYQIDTDGNMIPIGPIVDEDGNGFREVASLAFHPDGTLWAFANGGDQSRHGLITIDTSTAVATLVKQSEVKVEGLAWDPGGDTLWLAEHRRLYQYTQGSDITRVHVISELPGEIEGLEFRADGLLLAGLHHGGAINIYIIDVTTGQIITADGLDTNKFNDVESLIWPAGCDATILQPDTIIPETESVLTYSDSSGNSLNITVPTGVFNETTTLAYTQLNISDTGPTGLQFAHQAFRVNAYRNGKRLEQSTFDQPVTFRLEYNENDLAGLDENSLNLYYWDRNQNQWQEAACGKIDHHPDENWLVMPICHLTEFALFAEVGGQQSPTEIYLPIILREE